jgi:hypothetical protein
MKLKSTTKVNNAQNSFCTLTRVKNNDKIFIYFGRGLIYDFAGIGRDVS